MSLFRGEGAKFTPQEARFARVIRNFSRHPHDGTLDAGVGEVVTTEGGRIALMLDPDFHVPHRVPHRRVRPLPRPAGSELGTRLGLSDSNVLMFPYGRRMRNETAHVDTSRRTAAK